MALDCPDTPLYSSTMMLKVIAAFLTVVWMALPGVATAEIFHVPDHGAHDFLIPIAAAIPNLAVAEAIDDKSTPECDCFPDAPVFAFGQSVSLGERLAPPTPAKRVRIYLLHAAFLI